MTQESRLIIMISEKREQSVNDGNMAISNGLKGFRGPAACAFRAPFVP